jgi:hypothetical protein
MDTIAVLLQLETILSAQFFIKAFEVRILLMIFLSTGQKIERGVAKRVRKGVS